MTSLTSALRKHWYVLLAALVIVGLALGTVAFGATVAQSTPEPSPTPTVVTDAVRQERCVEWRLGMYPAHDDWSESITQMYTDGIARTCADEVANNPKWFGKP